MAGGLSLGQEPGGELVDQRLEQVLLDLDHHVTPEGCGALPGRRSRRP
jgi:hypothetical protein